MGSELQNGLPNHLINQKQKGLDENTMIAETWQVVVSQSLFGRYLENIFYIAEGAVMSTVRAQQLGELIKDWYASEMSVFMSSDWSVDFITVTSMDSGTPYEFIWTDGLPIEGQSDNGAAPVNVALQLTLYTGLTGRSARGRHFISGIPLLYRSGNNWLPAVQTLVQDAYYALQLALVPDDNAHVVVSRVSEGVERDPWVSYPVLSYLARSRVADMGRRLDNV